MSEKGKATVDETEQYQEANVVEDANRLPESLGPRIHFGYLASDSVPIHGMKDWTLQLWSDMFNQLPEESEEFAKGFLGDEAVGASPKDLPKLCKTKLDGNLSLEKWKLLVAYQNRCTHAISGRGVEPSDNVYMDGPLFWNYMFQRDFPLGAEDDLVGNWEFAIKNSGSFRVKFKKNRCMDCIVFLTMIAVLLFALIAMAGLMSKDKTWNLDATVQDPADPHRMTHIATRTKARGTVASCLTAFSFSLLVNGALDFFGQIDPSTSTVLIGMTLGGTFGFLLDNQLGSDEGFREYLWRPGSGMNYALGALASARYARYLLTIIFDMFFTVILFKLLFARMLRVPGFGQPGREWIANGMVSAFISLLTYQVYANMTRFEWAYPSGEEDADNQWISGSTMLLAVVIMNMVYLTAETRVKVGEPGINDPPVKLWVTLLTYTALALLQAWGVLDPSEPPATGGPVVTADPLNANLPLMDVCGVQSKSGLGLAIFLVILLSCLGFTIFATSRQSCTGLRSKFGGKKVPAEGASASDRLCGKCCLFLTFTVICMCIFFFFVAVPLYAAPDIRSRDGWGVACDFNDVPKLASMGLATPIEEEQQGAATPAAARLAGSAIATQALAQANRATQALGRATQALAQHSTAPADPQAQHRRFASNITLLQRGTARRPAAGGAPLTPKKE